MNGPGFPWQLPRAWFGTDRIGRPTLTRSLYFKGSPDSLATRHPTRALWCPLFRCTQLTVFTAGSVSQGICFLITWRCRYPLGRNMEDKEICLGLL